MLLSPCYHDVKSRKKVENALKDRQGLYKLQFLLVMCVFGCLGPLVRAIGLPSQVTACLRAWISAIALILYSILTKRAVRQDELRRFLWPMVLSGVFIALDWIGLFTSYGYTTIATATVCYYIVPVLVFLAAPLALGESFTARQLLCAIVAFGGMVLVSGVTEGGFSASHLQGPLFAFMGAVSYAGVILLNKRYPSGDALTRTTVQLAVAAVCTTPYALMSTDVSSLVFTWKSALLLLALGVGLTAITYIIYFDLIVRIPARTVAIFSYADPLVAVLISVCFLREPMSLPGAIGSALIIGAALLSEMGGGDQAKTRS